MRKPHIISIIALIWTITATQIHAQFPTKAFDSKIKTIQVSLLNDQLGLPIIELGSSDQIRIAFDLLDIDDQELYYTVAHCNTDWTISDLSELEFLDGFNNNPIRDYDFSFNTYTKYIHYELLFPNSDADLKVSGNYQVTIYRGSDKDKPLLRVCFAVAENKVSIGGIVKDITDIDYKKHHQQLEINIDLPNYSIRNPQTESTLVVYQNRRLDNACRTSTPLINTPRHLSYRNNRDLIFEATNTFRRFEMTQFRYTGLGVNGNRYIEPLFHVALNPIEQRNNRAFFYDRDQHGQFLINALNTANVHTEADYAFVHFSFPHQSPLEMGKLYVAGAFNNYTFDESSKMTYNFESECFETALLLKQGSYNYMVYNESNTKGKFSTSKVEGNFFETPNEYLILFYHRPFGERYDRLIGRAVFKQP